MHRLIEKDPYNQERIYPYIGGEEVNGSSTHSHYRYVINFGNASEREARKHPELMDILEEKVKPERQKKAKEVAQYPWWKFWRTRQELYEAAAGLNRVLVAARHQPNWTVAFMPSKMVFSDALVVFANEQNSFFCMMQSRIHEIWARFLGSSMKDDLRYTPSDCFETFPFPENWETDTNLETVGKRYYEFRAELMGFATTKA